MLFRSTGLDPDHLVTADYKTALQERLQSRGLPAPQYVTVETLGPDHRPLFHVEMRVLGRRIAAGEGPTIKRAQQEAAGVALNDFATTLAKIGVTEPFPTSETVNPPLSTEESLPPETDSPDEKT